MLYGCIEYLIYYFKLLGRRESKVEYCAVVVALSRSLMGHPNWVGLIQDPFRVGGGYFAGLWIIIVS